MDAADKVDKVPVLKFTFSAFTFLFCFGFFFLTEWIVLIGALRLKHMNEHVTLLQV